MGFPQPYDALYDFPETKKSCQFHKNNNMNFAMLLIREIIAP